MNNPTSLPDRLARAFSTPTGGVLGLVDELLAASQEQSIHIGWQAGRCHILFPGAEPPMQIEVPVPKSVVRAVLARIAALCNERVPHSVSPYQGAGEVALDPMHVIQVKFVNTPDELTLELSPSRVASSQHPLTAAVEMNGSLPPETSCGPFSNSPRD